MDTCSNKAASYVTWANWTFSKGCNKEPRKYRKKNRHNPPTDVYPKHYEANRNDSKGLEKIIIIKPRNRNTVSGDVGDDEVMNEEDNDRAILFNITNKIMAEIWYKKQSQEPHLQTEHFVPV
jgi:hypothetical protein